MRILRRLIGGHPPQTELTTGRAVFTPAYAVIPRESMRDIVTSVLPHWDKTRAWILARPMTGFAETFSQYIVEVKAEGSSQSIVEPYVESVLYVLDGRLSLDLVVTAKDLSSGSYAYAKDLGAGSYAYVMPGNAWQVHASTDARFVWIRKHYEFVEGIDPPDSFVTSEDDVEAQPMPDTQGAWTTKRFVDPADVRHDMHVNIVTFQPGAAIPFQETHVMEHGLLVLEGKAVYHLNNDWVEVREGDFLWLRAFCPQACYAGGPGPFRYLLYKDVNRHPTFLPRANLR